MLKKLLRDLKRIFPKGEFYIVGGTSRDFLLDKSIGDIDIATNLRPDDIKQVLPNEDYTFEKFGIVNIRLNGVKMTLATMRKDLRYEDYRHPCAIEFVDNYLIDASRRDFTINAIYLAEDGTILDPYNGLEDLKLKIIKTIGDSEARIKEDPLRVVRALRFSLNLGFQLDNNLYKAIMRNKSLLEKLNPQKVEEEIRKTDALKREDLIKFLNMLKNV